MDEIDIFTDASSALNIKIPPCIRNMLTINDYNDKGLLSEITENNLSDMEKFARETLHTIVDKSLHETYYGIFKDNTEKFQFLSSHRAIIFKIRDYCKSIHQTVSNTTLILTPSTEMQSRHRGTDGSREDQKTATKISCADADLTTENAHISKTLKAWLKCNLTDSQLATYEQKINELMVVSKLDANSILIACITCFLCKKSIKVHKISRKLTQKSRWVLGNFHKHILTHNQKSSTRCGNSTSNASTSHKSDTVRLLERMKPTTLTTYFQPSRKDTALGTTTPSQELRDPAKVQQTARRSSLPKIKVLQNICLRGKDPTLDEIAGQPSEEPTNVLEEISGKNLEENEDAALGSPIENLENVENFAQISEELYKKSSNEAYLVHLECKTDEATEYATKWMTPKYQRNERQKRARERIIPNQPLITNYYRVVDDLTRLMQENETLKEALLENWIGYRDANNSSKSPHLPENAGKLLTILMDTSMQNAKRPKNQNSYSATIKQFALYIFFIGGRLLYETLHANLHKTLPSITSLFRFINQNKSRPQEGSFRFSELNMFLEERNLPKYVWIGEDATRINGKIEYDSKTNNLIGFALPLKNGLPVCDSFEATSAKKIYDFFQNKQKANYAYVIMAQPLAENVPSFCLSIFGTDNKFTADDILKRWDEITKIASTFGITILGFSSDGDSRLLKAMKINTKLGQLSTRNQDEIEDESDIPEEISEEDSDWDSDGNCDENSFTQTPLKPLWSWFRMDMKFLNECYIQDTVHILTKMRTRLLKPSLVLPLGKYFASPTHLELLVQEYSKDKHMLTKSDLNPIDKMNFASAEKMCSNEVLNLIGNIPSSDGTAAFLKVMRFIIDSFLTKNIDIERRIYCIWYAVFFLRIWKSWLRKNKTLYKERDNFLSSNCYVCVELNAHALIKVLYLFITTKELKTEMFLPWLYGSQMCEKIFRATRSLTSTFSTVVNFSMLDILYRLNRIEIINAITDDLNDTITFPREKKKKLLDQNLNKLLENDSEEAFMNSIETIVNSALEDAISNMTTLGIRVKKDSWNKVFLQKIKKKEIPKKRRQNRRLKGKNKQKAVTKRKYLTTDASFSRESDQETSEEEEECIDDEQAILDEDENNNQNLAFDRIDDIDLRNDASEDIFEMSLLLNAGDSLLLKDYTGKSKEGNFFNKGPFVRIFIKDKISVVKKTTLCWLLSTESQRVSSDRLRRFICDSKSAIETPKYKTVDPIVKVEKREHLKIGDWCLFLDNTVKNTRSKRFNRKDNKSMLQNYVCGQVIYFKSSLKRKPSFVESKARGIGCLCTWYKIQNDRKLSQSPSFRNGFCDIAYYRLSMPKPSVIHDEKTDSLDLVLEEQNLSDLLMEIDKEIDNYVEDSMVITEHDFAIDFSTDDSADTDYDNNA